MSLPVSPHIIYSVTPTSGFKNEAYTFTANVSGTRPLSYQWDFGGGANPSLLSGTDDSVTAEVALGSEPGDYSALLTVTNPYGEASFPFTLIVEERQVWQHTWGTVNPNPFNGNRELAEGITVDDEGNVYVFGVSFAYDPYPALLLKYSPDGTLLYVKGYPGIGFTRILAAGSNQLLAAGESIEGIILLKMDAWGNVLTARSWKILGVYLWSNVDLALDDEGFIYVTGYKGDTGSDPRDVYLLKFNPDFEPVWAVQWFDGRWDFPKGLVSDAFGDVYLAGRSSTNTGATDAVLIRFSSDGDLVNGYRGDGLEFTAQQSTSKGLLVNGYSELLDENFVGLVNLSSLSGEGITISESLMRTTMLPSGRILVAGYSAHGAYWEITFGELSSDFIYVWASRLVGASSNTVPGLTFDGSGNFYVAWTFEQVNPMYWEDVAFTVAPIEFQLSQGDGGLILPIELTESTPLSVSVKNITGVEDANPPIEDEILVIKNF